MSLFNVDSAIFWVSIQYFRLLNIEVFLPARAPNFGLTIVNATSSADLRFHGTTFFFLMEKNNVCQGLLAKSPAILPTEYPFVG